MTTTNPTPQTLSLIASEMSKEKPYSVIKRDDESFNVEGPGISKWFGSETMAESLAARLNSAHAAGHSAAAASSAAEVEVLRREVRAWREWHAWITGWKPLANADVDETVIRAFAHVEQARTATDASGALNTQPGGSDENA